MKIRMPFAVLAAMATLGGGAEIAQSASVCTDPAYAQQDFSLGHWNVYIDGRKHAEVIMEKKLGGCAISETWIGAEGKNADGLGLFVYSRISKAWNYLWSSETGSTTSFTGQNVKPNEMLYVTEKLMPNGKMRLRHWTLSLLPNGNVRELSLGSEDQGKSWTTEYDVLWAKKPEAVQ